MAEQMDGAEFWLPAKFLMDDDIVVEKGSLKTKNSGKNNTDLLVPSHGFPVEFPYEFDSFDSFSALSSPVESVVGSTETESSDEDEFLAGLSRRLTQSTSQKLTVPSFSYTNEKTGVLGSSPQSTLSGLGSWSASSNGSPIGSSQVPSPPATPFGAQNDTWDLIYAVAGQVARLKVSNEASKSTNFNHRRSLPRAQNHGFMKNSISGLCSSQSLCYNLAQANESHRRHEQVLKPQRGVDVGRQVRASNWQTQLQLQQQQQQQIQSRLRNNVVGGRPFGLSQSSWLPLQAQSLPPPPQQQQQHQARQSSGSGMRAVFLAGSGSVKRKCAGTGVFLPRRYGNNPPEPRKKSGCSTALLPAKVVQALNLNFDDTDSHVQPHFNGPNYDALVARRNALLTQTGRNYRPDGGLNLPQEWTY